MVSETQDESAAPPEGEGSGHRPARGGVRRLVTSVIRLADLQYRIWLTQAKLTMMRMALYAVLFTGALVLGILGVIFLCIGVFHVLTDVLQIPEWGAFLIFGGGLALLALIFVLIATKMLTRTEAQDEQEGEK